MERMNKPYFYYLPACLCALTICALSTSATVHMPKISWFQVDKLGHFLAYAFFHLVIVWGMANQQKWQKIHWYFVLLSLGIVSLYGALMEWVQYLMPERLFDYADMTANVAGAIFGSLCIPFLFRFLKIRQ